MARGGPAETLNAIEKFYLLFRGHNTRSAQDVLHLMAVTEQKIKGQFLAAPLFIGYHEAFPGCRRFMPLRLVFHSVHQCVC